MNLSKTSGGKSSFNPSLSYHAPTFFAIFLLSNFLLSYTHFSLQWKLWIGVLGIGLPWGIGLALVLSRDEEPGKGLGLWKDEFLVLPLWPWVVGILLFLILRFYELTSVPFWLHFDEGATAQYALELTQKWNWSPLMPLNRVEAGYCWLLALFFKVCGVSLFSIRLFPALILTAATATAYWSVREFFSKSISFLAVCFMGLGFWADLLGRQCDAHGLMLWMEVLVLGVLGRYLNSTQPWLKFRNLALLSVLVALGFYTYTPWVALALAVALAVFRSLQGPRFRNWWILVFIMPLAVGVAPLLGSRMSQGGSVHITSLIGRPAALDYLICLFWNGLGSAPYGPSWGGMLNPILGALVLTGFLDLCRERSRPAARWILFSLFIFFLPGSLSSYVQINRILLLLPLFVVLAAAGVRSLLTAWTVRMEARGMIALVLLGGSIFLDTFHYWGPSQDWDTFVLNKRHWMSVDYARAFREIEKEGRNGKVFRPLLNLNNKNNDWTLDLAVYPYDALRNPHLEGVEKASVILLVNSNYEPFFQADFPGSRWIWLSPDLPSGYGGFLLGFLSSNPNVESRVKRWIQADSAFRENNRLYERGDSPDILLRDLREQYGLFHGDPFLESVYWAKVAFYEDASDHAAQAAEALLQGVRRGWPAAYLYNELGVLETRQGLPERARLFFEKALQAPVNRTSALENLHAVSTGE